MSNTSTLGSLYDSAPGSNPVSGAVVWHGSSASITNLNNGIQSVALATSGVQQGGWTILFQSQTGTHAMLWSGTAASGVDLHPAGYFDTRVTAMTGAFQVGDGWVGGPAWSPGATRHALLWKGSANSVVDLNQIIPNVQQYVTITGADTDGNIVGYMTDTPGRAY